MTMSAAGRVHLHADDCPRALAALAGALTARRHDVVGLHDIGYEPTAHGAWVDWDALEHSWLSSTERAAVVVARGIAMAERQGGWAPQLHQVLVGALDRTATGTGADELPSPSTIWARLPITGRGWE